MKFVKILACLALFPALAAQAQEEKPCQKIKAACEAAGYKKGDHKKTGKGLIMDCLKKIKAGDTVEGVSIAAEDLSACQAKAEKRREKKASRKAGQQKE